MYLGSSVSSTESNVNTRLAKPWTAIDKLLIIWKSDLSDELIRNFFLEAVVSILLYGCTTWSPTKMYTEKDRQELYKNVMNHAEQILLATIHKTTTVQTLTAHL